MCILLLTLEQDCTLGSKLFSKLLLGGQILRIREEGCVKKCGISAH